MGVLEGQELFEAAKLHSHLTRTPAKVMHGGERFGSVANYVGRWSNNRGESGPWSMPLAMLLAEPEGGVEEEMEMLMAA